MTERDKTVTEHLEAALAHLGNVTATTVGSAAEVIHAAEAVERALSVIQRARCDAVAALDKL